MDANQVSDTVSQLGAEQVALSIQQITGWVMKIIGALSGVIALLGTVVAYLFRSLITEQKKWSETQIIMQKETNQIINDNTQALDNLSDGIKSIPQQIETVLKLHLLEKK